MPEEKKDPRKHQGFVGNEFTVEPQLTPIDPPEVPVEPQLTPIDPPPAN